jgi:2-methylcitrate dehydratase PrpD
MNETRELAQWLARLTFSDLPKRVVDVTKRFILDDVGCMLGGALQLGNKELMKDVLAQGENPECTIAVYGHKTSAPSAALVNGAFIAGWDYDSMTREGGHMGSQTAAMLAMIEREMCTGKDAITAECAGIEAFCRIGIATNGVGERFGPHPWHSNTVLGPFSAAVTTGKILDFDAETMENAISIAAESMGGNYQHFYGWGSSMKRIRCGVGAWSGIRAALLAEEGLIGPKEALEGHQGYLEAMHGRADDGELFYDSDHITEDLGKKWYTLTYNTKGSGFPCCDTAMTPCVTAAALREQHNFRTEDIESVVVEHCSPRGPLCVGNIAGTNLGSTPIQRLGSIGWSQQWMVAMSLVLGKGGIREQLKNIRPCGRFREIEELSRKVKATVNKEYYAKHFKGRPYPSAYGGRIVIALKDGRILDHEPLPFLGCTMSDGSVNTPTFMQLREKMAEQAPLAGISKGKQDIITRTISHLEDQNDLDLMISAMVR